MCVISLADVPSRVWKYCFWPSTILQDVLDHGIELKYADGRLFPFLFLNILARSDAVYVRRLLRAKKGKKKSYNLFII